MAAYAARLNSVEVNYTFRSLPSAATVAGWLQETPEAFRFSFKAPQRITHFSRLRNCAALLSALVASIQAVIEADRIGILLFQLPPNFQADQALLSDFLAEASATKLRLAFEFRHASWFCDTTYAALAAHGAALCVAGSDELETPEIATAPFACYRLRKSNYTEAELAGIRTLLAARAADGEVFAYFKHEDEPTGPLRAAAVLDGLRA